MLFELQIHPSSALNELALHGEGVSSLQEAATVTYQGCTSSISE